MLFFGFMVAAFVLIRDAEIESLRFFWILITILISNALYLRTRELHDGRTGLISIGTNSLFIAYLVDSSGGCASPLWPLFLLPIYTAGFSLPRWVMRSAGLNIALLACFYINPESAVETQGLLELFVKMMFLLVSSVFVARLAFNEQLSARSSARKRRRLLSFAKRLLGNTRVVTDAAHGLGNRVSVILGTAELLIVHAPPQSEILPDLERIFTAADQCRKMIADIRLTREYRPPSLQMEDGRESSQI
ncbi:MAG: hypothetical protein COB53_00995 [Elusimicrobia bacterium]|nr:MAG: hypothetical protein COB53_00995 [Elusimicrobiota bacterium]